MRGLFSKIEEYDGVVIFGAAEVGQFLFSEIADFCGDRGKPLVMADNSCRYWDYRKILPPVDTAARFPDALWLIASEMRNELMYNDLITLGIKPGNIIKDLPQDIINRKREADAARRLTPQDVLQTLEVHVASHCNLKCAGCSTFSPLVSEPVLYDPDTFNKDIARMSDLLGENLHSIILIGGEPLLNKDIEAIIKSARKHFPGSSISVLSNGLLLPDIPDSFWHTCRESEIKLYVTRYTINFDYDKLPAIAEKNGVSFMFYEGSIGKSRWHLAFDPSGENDQRESFSGCFMANRCVTLRDGKLATCQAVLNIEFLNKAFGTDMKPSQTDFIDIYKAQSEHEVLEFLSKPPSVCRFCNVKERTYENPWGISKRNILEWVLEHHTSDNAASGYADV